VTVISLPQDATTAASQLLSQQERALKFVQRIRDELDTPLTRALVSRLSKDSKTEARESVVEVLSKVEDTLRAIQFCQSELHRELMAPQQETLEKGGGLETQPGADGLPEAMLRFLATRQAVPGFTYELDRDAIRGWVIHWKEYTDKGVVRGAGHFYERPYAWLER
jgi:hypothetical protein